MKRCEVLKSLDHIFDMSDEEIFSNAGMIRQAALEAYSLVKQQQAEKEDRCCVKRVRGAIADIQQKLPADSTLSRNLAIEILRGCLSGKKVGR